MAARVAIGPAPALPLPLGPAVRGGFSTRAAGDLSLDAGAGGAWRRFRAAAGLEGVPIALARQVHGAGVVVADAAALDRAALTASGVFVLGEADALVARGASLAVGVRTADCLPLLLADLEAGAVGAVHAGWRGIAAGVVDAAVAAIRRLGARPERIEAVLGPAIAGPCYRVGDDVATAWRDAGVGAALRPDGPGRWRADLAAAARLRLEALGLAPDRVRAETRCTHCEPGVFFSYRRDGATGRHVSAVALAAA